MVFLLGLFIHVIFVVYSDTINGKIELFVVGKNFADDLLIIRPDDFSLYVVNGGAKNIR